jgi:hypothetical protein
MRALLVANLLQDVAGALSNHDQFVTHGRSGSVADRMIQLSPCARNLTVATDGLNEA